MDYNKPCLFDKRAKSSKKIFQYKFSNCNVNKGKRRSNEIIPNNFSNKFKEMQNSKINKIPTNHRLSLQNSNMLYGLKISKSPKKNNEKPIKRDKDYYLNILNEIYLNDSHLSNKSKKIKFEKDNSNKFSRYRSSKNIPFKFGTKSTNKKYSLFSNEYRNKSHRKLNIFNNIQTKDEKSVSKNTDNFCHNIKSKRINRKYLSTKTVSKFKTSKDKNSKKNQISLNDNEKNVDLNDTLKDEKNNEMINKEIKSKKKICKIIHQHEKHKSNNKNNEKEETEMDIYDTNNNISNKKKVKTQKTLKLRKCCFFCCLTANDNDKEDSYSDNI